MTETVRCPDCGHPNPSGSESCSACNFPLRPEPLGLVEEPTSPESSAETPAPADGPRSESKEAGPPIFVRPIRPRRPRPASNQALSLWLMFAFIAAAAVIYTAIKANVDRAHQNVEGSSEEQQKRADQFLAALQKDSTDVEAHIALGNIFYDTGNWPEAIVHYRAVLRRDSTRTPVLVDLGVCYYNLDRTDEAERLFLLALKRDPHQAVALFNLGIVNERRKNYEAAFQYFHRALQSGPPEEMKQAIMEAMQRVQQAAGKTAPPLPDGK